MGRVKTGCSEKKWMRDRGKGRKTESDKENKEN